MIIELFDNKKITVYADEIILQVLSRGNEHMQCKCHMELRQFKRSVGSTFGARGKVCVVVAFSNFVNKLSELQF